MRRFHRLQLFAAVFLLAQFVLGYAGWFTPRHEIFPFASWLLFVLVPDRLTDYDLRLYGSPTQPLLPPRPFNQSLGWVSAPHSIAAYQLTQQLGEAVESGDPLQIRKLRRQVEEQFVAVPMRYDLLKLSYRPVARWKTGEVLASRTVASFIAGQTTPLPVGTAAAVAPSAAPAANPAASAAPPVHP